MDFKDFYDGLLSSSLLLIIFSITLLYTSIFLKPYIALEPIVSNYIIILSIFNLFFASLYLFCSVKVKKVFKLELKNIIKFGKILTIININYTPHFVFMLSIFLFELHNLLFFMILLNCIIEFIIVGIVYVEIYDLLFKRESERKFEFEKNKKYYFKEKD
jgi:hypothetical protein